MKRTVLSAAAAAVLVLSACSADESTPAESPAAAEVDPKSTSLDDVTVSGEVGTEPTVEFEAPLALEGSGSELISEGDGEVVEEGMMVEAHQSTFSGRTGELNSTTYDMEKPSQFGLVDTSATQLTIDAIAGHKVGSRILIYANGPMQQNAESETILYVFDIVGVGEIPYQTDKAEGEEKELPEGFPEVTRNDEGVPSISAPEADPPQELKTAYAIEGKGDEVRPGQTVRVNYTGWLWDDTTEPFDSSWERGQPFPVENIGEAGVIAGWNEGLVGQKVGSQVVLVVPPDKGYGENGSPPSIPGGATLVFVVDILSAVG